MDMSACMHYLWGGCSEGVLFTGLPPGPVASGGGMQGVRQLML